MISVIIPSRLAINPASSRGNTWLGRAVMGVQDQEPAIDCEIVVGLDPGVDIETARAKSPRFKNVVFVNAPTAGQASAVNAAVRASTGDVLAFAEDDDWWTPQKLAVQLQLLPAFDMITCNQREVDEWGNFIRYNNFPTPSGWMMRRGLWATVGELDETFRWHIDTEWLGRANAAKIKRCHVIQDGCPQDDWLKRVAAHSEIAMVEDIAEPVVHRCRNPKGGMSTIATNQAAYLRSVEEHTIMVGRFGEVPW